MRIVVNDAIHNLLFFLLLDIELVQRVRETFIQMGNVASPAGRLVVFITRAYMRSLHGEIREVLN